MISGFGTLAVLSLLLAWTGYISVKATCFVLSEIICFWDSEVDGGIK